MFRNPSLFIGTSFTVAVFTIFATSNVHSIVGIPPKIYSMQIILIHIKADLFVKCAHLHPGYAANLVARSRYYHCHRTVLNACTATVVPHIGPKLGSLWCRPMKRPLLSHCFATQCHYIGLTLVSTHDTAPLKPLFCQTLAWQGVFNDWLLKLPV